MTNLFTSKTNFTAGELSQSLLGRVDLKAYDNGAMALKNVRAVEVKWAGGL